MSSTKPGLGKALLQPLQTPSRPPSRASQAPIQGQTRWETIVGLYAAILAVLEATHWPRKSERSVTSLIDVLKQVPTVPSPSQSETTSESADVNLDSLVSAIQNVKTKLDAAAERHGASTKSITYFHRSETCNQILNTCREEISAALTAYHSTANDNQIEGKLELRATSLDSISKERHSIQTTLENPPMRPARQINNHCLRCPTKSRP
ncbi:hypothetical protein FRC01_000844 [Tulasnella sp. 417]|nr:hypothetical protein FRC01_000844 [Tulasnella sp. 417]